MKELYRGRYISFTDEEGDEEFRCYGLQCWDRLIKYDLLEPVMSTKELDQLDNQLTPEQIAWLDGVDHE